MATEKDCAVLTVRQEEVEKRVEKLERFAETLIYKLLAAALMGSAGGNALVDALRAGSGS